MQRHFLSGPVDLALQSKGDIYFLTLSDIHGSNEGLCDSNITIPQLVEWIAHKNHPQCVDFFIEAPFTKKETDIKDNYPLESTINHFQSHILGKGQLISNLRVHAIDARMAHFFSPTPEYKAFDAFIYLFVDMIKRERINNSFKGIERLFQGFYPYIVHRGR